MVRSRGVWTLRGGVELGGSISSTSNDLFKAERERGRVDAVCTLSEGAVHGAFCVSIKRAKVPGHGRQGMPATWEAEERSQVQGLSMLQTKIKVNIGSLVRENRSPKERAPWRSTSPPRTKPWDRYPTQYQKGKTKGQREIHLLGCHRVQKATALFCLPIKETDKSTGGPPTKRQLSGDWTERKTASLPSILLWPPVLLQPPVLLWPQPRPHSLPL